MVKVSAFRVESLSFAALQLKTGIFLQFLLTKIDGTYHRITLVFPFTEINTIPNENSDELIKLGLAFPLTGSGA